MSQKCDCFYNERNERIYCVPCIFADEEGED